MTKALLCGDCLDIRGLPRDEGWVSCSCGNAWGRWVDGRAGTVAAWASRDRETVRLVGIANTFLLGAFEPRPRGLGLNEDWRRLHEEVVDATEGYVFHRSKRACPVAFVRVGQTSDIRWVEDWPGLEAPGPTMEEALNLGPLTKLDVPPPSDEAQKGSSAP